MNVDPAVTKLITHVAIASYYATRTKLMYMYMSLYLSRQLLVLTCRKIAIVTTHMLAVVLSAVPFKIWILSA